MIFLFWSFEDISISFNQIALIFFSIIDCESVNCGGKLKPESREALEMTRMKVKTKTVMAMGKRMLTRPSSSPSSHSGPSGM